MTCPHSVLESVEFAERDSFFYSPDANHHIECFDIVGSVVLWVIYLFHIPYQILCKDRKTLHISQRGGMELKTYEFLCQNINANIVNINGKTKPLPVMLSRGAYSLGGNQ